MADLEVKDLKCHYNTDTSVVPAVDGISLSLEAGEIVGVIGESGSGKTTLGLSIMRLLDGLASVSGTIVYKGTDITHLPEPEIDRIRWKDIAIVFQNNLDILNPVMTVGKQVVEPLLKHEEIPVREAQARCADLFRTVGLDPVWMDAYPHQLSGGMRQRVLLAMALSCDPKLLILDEVTSALDAFTRKEIRDLLIDLQKKNGYSMILISHDLSFVSSLASRMIVLYAGRVVESGPTVDIINAPRHPYTRGLVHSTPDIFVYKDLWGIPGESASEDGHAGCPFSRRCTQPIEICRTSPPRLQSCGDGREVACHRGGIATLLRADAVHFRYPLPGRKTLHAVNGVDMDVCEGEVLAIVGQTASGKSTLAHILAGILRPESGEVRFMDGAVHSGNNGHRFGGIQIVFQDPFSSTSNRFTVLDAVREPFDINRIGTAAERLDMTREALKLVRLPPTDEFLGKYCGALSGGQRQRVALARAMIMKPRLLIADEITSALDVSTAANVLRLLKGLQNRRGFAMIYISHDLSLTLKIADRIAVMDAGRIIEIGNAHEVMLHPRDDRTKRLIGTRVGHCCHDHKPVGMAGRLQTRVSDCGDE
ncbi:ABC transporter ATP-binding protein [Methanoculleus sp. FWC-SCC1]|uniref:Nickel import system ATP-binding protein NikD n=1 Tax=Methanoculleus frigidifontis TaxID=2584085 RepID=A0ABT8M8W9_9EURY|nr:ABC transporter ATP-binding protein [Methanoculleus sp. FWC-SCC1]MDN7024377.1 ABC transporter ATP-binding protein [Methanoculleus sp. FWC-SCC1]